MNIVQMKSDTFRVKTKIGMTNWNRSALRFFGNCRQLRNMTRGAVQGEKEDNIHSCEVRLTWGKQTTICSKMEATQKAVSK